MKTIEEKAKAYDKARECFKSFKEKYYTKDTILGDVIFDKTGEMQKDFEQIFPELRESEDEKIIEEIKFAVTQMPSERQDTKDKCLDWLEKQKEYKSLPLDLSIEDVETIKTALRESGLEFTSNQKVYNKLKKKPESAYYSSTVGRSELCPDGRIIRYTIGYLEKQKESLHISESCKENADSFTSEDERIRKRLLWFLANYNGRWDYPETRMACRAWLEKQKDASKAIEAVERIDKYIDEHLANAHDMKDSNPDKKYYRGWDDALGKMAGILQDVYSEEKPKEQKSADDKAFEEWIDDWYQGSKEAGGDIVMSEAEFKNWSRGIRNMYQQKPAWSEEDEKKREQVIKILEQANENWRTAQGSVPFGTLISWLKSLRPQPKAEWSEEDEKMRNLAIEWAETMSGQCSFVGMDSTDFRKIINWLKSLRPQPHWKPSEEQIQAIIYLASSIPPNFLKEQEYSMRLVAEVIEDLKKL